MYRCRYAPPSVCQIDHHFVGRVIQSPWWLIWFRSNSNHVNPWKWMVQFERWHESCGCLCDPSHLNSTRSGWWIRILSFGTFGSAERFLQGIYLHLARSRPTTNTHWLGGWWWHIQTARKTRGSIRFTSNISTVLGFMIRCFIIQMCFMFKWLGFFFRRII